MKIRVPLSIPHVEGNAWRYLKDCLDTGWVSSVGSYVDRFESGLARYSGSRHAVAGASGTACLHVALKVFGVGPGDGVIVPALTFIATANAVTYCGGVCVFMDCDPLRFNLDLDRLEAFLENDCVRRGGRPLTRRRRIPLKAILPTHVLGFPIDMPRLMRIARRHGLVVIEDAAESVGSSWKGRHTGTFGSAGVLSFNGNKIITCGGGGAILSNNGSVARRARHLTTQAKAEDAEYVHDEVGYNYRMTNISAALGLSQLEVLPKFLKRRERISGWYRERLRNVPVEPIPGSASWNRWLLAAQAASAREKSRLLRRLNADGCEARPLWVPVPLQKRYRGALSTPIPNAKRAYATVLNIPSSTCLKESDVSRAARGLKRGKLDRLLV